MKHKLNYLPLLAIAMLAYNVATSQAPGIAVKLLSYNITPDSVANLGYTITVSAELTNEDSSAFSGTIDFGLRNTNFLINDSNVFNKPWYSGIQPINLNSFETVPAIFSIQIDPQYFAPGPDVVVVWPISNKPVTDSVVIYLQIASPSSDDDIIDQSFGYAVLPDRLQLFYNNHDIQFNQVRIFNTLGECIFTHQQPEISTVMLPDLSTGIYLCEFWANDNRRKVVKLFLSGK